MELPAALIPWRESLEWLEPTAALALGPQLQRLDLAFGPFRAASRSGDGDPDGFNGLARRGTYERLLISEWLLAEELPEEFTRRALAGEHSFLHLARRAPTGEQQCIALFDAGPDQWGMPRTAHLAALMVLERRARAAGTSFRWGILQDDEYRLRPAGDQAALRQLLAQRSPLPVSRGQLTEWSSRCSAPGREQQELWIIGGAQAVSLAATGMSALRLDEPLEPGTNRLDATVFRPSTAPKAVKLPLPDEATGVRLLRDPFQAAVAAPQRTGSRFTPASNLLFSTSGSKLLARAHNGALISYPIPNSPQAGVGKPRLLVPRMPGTLIAAGRTRKVTLGLLLDQPTGRLHLECLSGTNPRLPDGPVPVPPPLRWDPDDDMPLGLLHGIWQDSRGELLAHVQDMLLCFKKSISGERVTELVAKRVENVTTSTNGLTYISRSEDDWLKTPFVTHPTAARILRVGAGNHVCSGFGGALANPQWGLSGLEMADGSWSVESGETRWQFNPPAGSEVFGVTGPPNHREGPGIVMLEADRRTISVLGLNWTHHLPEASAEIRQMTVSNIAAQIAYATVQGEVVIYSLRHAAILYRLTPTGDC